jgi:fumarate reductase subunit C
MDEVHADAVEGKVMATYTEDPTKGYRVRMSTYWWLGKWPYLKFILRELSSIFVAWFVIETLMLIKALSEGLLAYAEYQQFLQNPLVVALNVISLFFVVFHTITWFNLAPKAMAVRMGGKRVPNLLIAGPNYVAWVVVSAAVAWLVLRG